MKTCVYFTKFAESLHDAWQRLMYVQNNMIYTSNTFYTDGDDEKKNYRNNVKSLQERVWRLKISAAITTTITSW